MFNVLNLKFILFCSLFLLLSIIYELRSNPDLEIACLEEIGPTTVNVDGEVEIPVRIIIKNIGEDIASQFNIVTEYILSNGTYEARFVLSGVSFEQPLFNSVPLGLGREVHVYGKAIFPKEHYGWNAALKARVECCEPGYLLPDHNHIKESYTDNNESLPIKVTLRDTQIASTQLAGE